tara:strand:- start:5007 stop:6062 length:1056 start_codon:yes stop_codon:yes gene_type:complete
MKAVILMTRLSDYMLNCFRMWHIRSGVELHIVRLGVDPREAPFDFPDSLAGISFYEREAMNDAAINEMILTLQPQLVICFGWADNGYLGAVRNRPTGTGAVMTMDTQWRGTFRQVLGMVWGRLRITHLFDFVWVPGTRQYRFARLIGFPKSRIREGLLVANETNFAPILESYSGAPIKRLVFIGRYLELKGLRELWQGFIDFHETHESDLTLVCIGTGPLEAEAPDHHSIQHLGFVQPKDFREVLKGGGIFILPSHREAWGLVVHEFAIAGFPMVLSKAVGAVDRFLDDDNGLLLKEVTPEAITRAVIKIDSLDEKTLAAMSRSSAAKGAALTVDNWCAQADAFLKAAKRG